MQLRRTRVLAAWVGGALAAAPVPVTAGVEEHEAGLRFELFADSDDVHVFSTGSDYAVELTGDASLFLGWDREVVVVPAIGAPAGSQEAVDAISGASRPISSNQDPFSDFRKTRNQIDTNVQWRVISAGYYLSDESDYFAQKVSGGAGRMLFGDNLQLSAGASYGWDRIDPLQDDDTATGSDEKNTFHWSVVATQVVTPTTIVQGGFESARVRGLQHNPYRTVYVDGGYVAELHPDKRARRDGFVKVKQYLPNRSALHVSYKLYDDDWGIASHTIGTKLHQYVSDDVIVRYRYRFYSQGAADFWRDDYTEPGGAGGFQTGDYRLGDFSAHLFGTKVSWNLGRGPLAIPALTGIRATLKYERYFNSNNFSANIFESGISLSF